VGEDTAPGAVNKVGSVTETRVSEARKSGTSRIVASGSPVVASRSKKRRGMSSSSSVGEEAGVLAGNVWSDEGCEPWWAGIETDTGVAWTTGVGSGSIDWGEAPLGVVSTDDAAGTERAVRTIEGLRMLERISSTDERSRGTSRRGGRTLAPTWSSSRSTASSE
jgi:hypothetical protein